MDLMADFLDKEPRYHITDNGYQSWSVDGVLHRLDGPASINRWGHQVWRFKGVVHRLDGPALTYPEGYREWFIKGKKLPTDDVEAWVKNHDIIWPFDRDTQMEFFLKWG